jgi:hypothetical protein
MKSAGRFLLLNLSALLILSHTPGIHAGYLDDVGFTDLQDELENDMPTGAGVIVSQIEARSSGNYMPDVTDTEFSGKTIVNISDVSDGTTSHATTVGKYFYGNSQSMAGGITDIHIYPAPIGSISITCGSWTTCSRIIPRPG